MPISNNNARPTDSHNVQQRLLDAAEQLFSENGFKATTIRKIAKTAKCNVAAANYYFGSKEKLYLEVWRRQFLRLRNARLKSIQEAIDESKGKPELEKLLEFFARAFVGPLINSNEQSDRLMKLIAYEMSEQQLPANMFIEEVVKPTTAAMREALTKTCPGVDESKIPLMIFSLVGQLAHILWVKTMFGRTGDKEMAIKLDEAVEHIVKFSAAGICSYTK